MCPKTLVQPGRCPPLGCHKVRACPRYPWYALGISLVSLLEYNVSLYVAALLFILIPAASTQGLVSAAGG